MLWPGHLRMQSKLELATECVMTFDDDDGGDIDDMHNCTVAIQSNYWTTVRGSISKSQYINVVLANQMKWNIKSNKCISQCIKTPIEWKQNEAMLQKTKPSLAISPAKPNQTKPTRRRWTANCVQCAPWTRARAFICASDHPAATWIVCWMCLWKWVSEERSGAALPWFIEMLIHVSFISLRRIWKRHLLSFGLENSLTGFYPYRFTSENFNWV